MCLGLLIKRGQDITGMSLKLEKGKLTAFFVLVLILIGIVCIGLRVHFMLPASPLASKNHWRIVYTIKFRPHGEASHGWIALPKRSPRIQIKEETFSLQRS